MKSPNLPVRVVSNDLKVSAGKAQRLLRNGIAIGAGWGAVLVLAFFGNSESVSSQVRKQPAAETAVLGGAVNPGGVAGQSLWVKADLGLQVNGSDQVEQWLDQSGSGNTVSELRASHPTHADPVVASAGILRVANGINFNPAVDFSGALGKSLKANAATEWDATPLSIFTVALTEGAPVTAPAAIFDGLSSWTVTGNGAGIGIDANASSYTLDGNGCQVAFTTSPVNVPRVVRGVYVSGTNGLNGSTWLNGGQEGTGTGCSTSASTFFEVGGRTAGTTSGSTNLDRRVFNGKITEVVVYKSVLSAADSNKVESYLAVKYGVTLRQTPSPQNYVISDGTVTWDAGVNGLYNDDIAGIGRDDVSALNQKQSASVNAGNFLTIGLGAISVDNQANPNSFGADKDFLIWGHNAAATAFNVPVGGVALVHMPRVWKADETGTVGSVVIRVPQSLFTNPFPTLIRSTNDTFDSGDTLIPMTLNGTNYEATIDLNNVDFFTFAQFVSPTAADATIMGRVVTADGRGIRNVRLIVEGGGLSEPKIALTSAFGYYSFEGLESGDTYVLSVQSKRFHFDNPVRVIDLGQDAFGVDFVASP
jgi:hypothetical protein